MTYEQLISAQRSALEQGNRGEEFVLEYERRRLPEYLAQQVLLLDRAEVALGYDILSYESKDSLVPDRYIEVKTYRGHPHFYWTENEIAAARHYKDQYHLYLVDASRICETGYEPRIIPYPALLMDDPVLAKKMGMPEMVIKPQQYVCSALNETAVPDDWDESVVLFGCYNSEEHLQWIRSNRVYNVRSKKQGMVSVNGEVAINESQVQNARYLVLYSVANPLIYNMYVIQGKPRLTYKKAMVEMGYPNPHANAYVLHELSERRPTFYLDIQTLLRELNHTHERRYGTPLYLTGIQLRRFMNHKTYPQPQEYACMVADDAVPWKRGMPWTPGDEEELMQLFKQGVCLEDIAKHFGRTKNAIIARLGKLGVIRDVSCG